MERAAEKCRPSSDFGARAFAARLLGGKGDANQAGAARRIHHVDHGLVGGRGIGADDDHDFAAVLGGLRQSAGERFNGTAFQRVFVDGVAAIGADGHDHLFGGGLLGLRIGHGQVHLQAG